MPYTPPAQRSPATSAPHSPAISRRSSNGTATPPLSLTVTNPRPSLPRSTSYLTRHRRTPSVKSATLVTTFDPSPPGTADKENEGIKSLTTSGSLRQSPPPMTGETQMPPGAVISPPDSAQNSSDDEESRDTRSRNLSNLAELQAAIRNIEQRGGLAPERLAQDAANLNQALTLIVPSSASALEDKSTAEHVEQTALESVRRLTSPASSVPMFIDLRQPASPETPVVQSDEDESDTDVPERSRQKPPMLRKKSGELVRPALRPSSARRRPSSMPGTPTFSKAVHFDSHLEHVRHFLQVDRPLAVSAGSSPVEAYGSDTEFPFDDSSTKTPPFEWEIVTSNFPSDTPLRLAQPIKVERVFLSADNKNMIGTVSVANIAFSKFVVARFTLDYWKTTSEVVAEYNNDVRQPKHTDGRDRFNFSIKLADLANLEAKTMFFCVKYAVNGTEYWDNNNSTNFQVDFKKKAKPQNGKKVVQGAASRPANALPRSNKRSSPAAARPLSMPDTFDDFADGFDAKYNFEDFKQPVHDFLGDRSSGPLRLKGIKSAINISSESLTRKAPQPNGQAFGNRYDFGASLSAAINAANTALGDRSGLKISGTSAPKKVVEDAVDTHSPVAMNNAKLSSKSAAKIVPASAIKTSGTDSPRPLGADKPLTSQSYSELLDRYCFFGSVKNSPQLNDGTLRSGQYDGANDDAYMLGSVDSSANSSPLMMTEKKPSPPRSQNMSAQASRSTSPAPMTGFVTGTSPKYPYQLHNSFPFRDAHAATAIRG